ELDQLRVKFAHLKSFTQRKLLGPRITRFGPALFQTFYSFFMAASSSVSPSAAARRSAHAWASRSSASRRASRSPASPRNSERITNQKIKNSPTDGARTSK